MPSDRGLSPGRYEVRAHAAMLGFAAAISASFTIGDAVADKIDPVALTFVRFVIASAIFGAITAMRGGTALPGPVDCLRYLAIGLCPVAYFTLMFVALRYTGSVSTSAIFTLSPMMTALIAWGLLRQSFRPRQWLILTVAALGAVWVVFDGSLLALASFTIGWGEIVFFFGSAAYAIYAPLIRFLHRGESMTVLTLWVLVAGAVFLGLFGWNRIAEAPWSELPITVWLAALYLSVFSTAISFFLIQFASLHLPAGKVMAYTYLIPAFVLIQNALTGLGWPGPSVVMGIIVIGLATFALQRS